MKLYESPTLELLRADDGQLQLRVIDTQDAAAVVTVEVLQQLAALVTPSVLLPDGKWSPDGYRILLVIRAALQALDEHKDPNEQFAIREWVRMHVGRKAA